MASKANVYGNPGPLDAMAATRPNVDGVDPLVTRFRAANRQPDPERNDVMIFDSVALRMSGGELYDRLSHYANELDTADPDGRLTEMVADLQDAASELADLPREEDDDEDDGWVEEATIEEQDQYADKYTAVAAAQEEAAGLLSEIHEWMLRVKRKAGSFAKGDTDDPDEHGVYLAMSQALLDVLADGPDVLNVMNTASELKRLDAAYLASAIPERFDLRG